MTSFFFNNVTGPLKLNTIFVYLFSYFFYFISLLTKKLNKHYSINKKINKWLQNFKTKDINKIQQYMERKT